MSVNPDDILAWYGLLGKKLRIIAQNSDQLIAVLLKFVSLILNMPLEVSVFQFHEFRFGPKYGIIDVFREISNEIVPSWLFSPLVFVQQIWEQYSVLPLACEPPCKKLRIFHKNSID